MKVKITQIKNEKSMISCHKAIQYKDFFSNDLDYKVGIQY